MKGKHLTRRWNDIFSIVILIIAAVFISVVVASLVEIEFASFTILVVISGVG